MIKGTIGTQGPLSQHDLRVRAVRISLVLTDCDGVLTDSGVYYSERGEELKRFSIRDGMGFERLRNANISTAIITGERSACVARRAEKLQARAFLGVKDKAGMLDSVLDEYGLALENVAFIGDDVNDVPIIRRILPRGLVGAPRDAMPEVRSAAHHLCEFSGGHGAFRDFAEWILGLRGAS